MQSTRAAKVTAYAIFIVLGFLAMQVPFSQLMGVSNLRFNLFDFYGPIAGAYLGALPGLICVLLMQIVNWAIHGFATDLGTLIRFLPVLGAMAYFAKQSKWTLAIPVIAMIAFWAHPEGRAAWYYALYWLIPLAAYPLYKKSLLARALGATFTQHSIGGALWVWAFNMKAAVWIGLIPVVWKERLLMAIGITLTTIAMNYLLALLARKTRIQLPVHSVYASSAPRS